MRVIHAVRELNAQRHEPIRLIALYTEPERDAMFVREADEAVCLGPATSTLRRRGAAATSTTPRSSARSSRRAPTPPGSAGASWPSSPSSPSCASGSGIVFVGPDADGHAPRGRQDRGQAAGRGGGRAGRAVERRPGRDAEEALRHAARIGFPLMIKAAAGGGGRGIRRVDEPDALPGRVRERARRGARRRSATARVLLEQLVDAGAPHRGAGHRRRPGHARGRSACATAPAAAQPEGDRGVARAPR